NRYSKLEINFNRIKKTFSVDAEGSRSSFFASALEEANLADLLISMGGGYIRTCAEHLIMAKACMNTVDQLSTVDFSILMPSIVGMACQDGAHAVAANKIGYQIVSSGLAPHPDWEYCVEATEPAGGAEVSLSEGTTALVSCFENLDIPAYLATVDCSWLPGGTAVYDHGQRIGVCDCINGTVFNPSKTRCINCEEYFQSMVSSFNAGDLDTAQAWVNEARWCPWSAEAQ
ncbi:MAG: hypothetical protein GQ563_06970, partial [Desulfuromusa sp.]|nr:hypothetical protein [Desulfuromusa sp.]